MMIKIPSRVEQTTEQLKQKYYLGRRVLKKQVKLFGIEILIYTLSIDLSFEVLPDIKLEGSEYHKLKYRTQ